VVDVAAGAKLRASVINAAYPLFDVLDTSQSKSSSTTMTDVTGLSVALAANSTYIWDGYIAFNAGATGDFRCAFAVPASTTGHWALWGLSTGSTGGVGTLNGSRIDGYGDANFLAAGGSDAAGGVMACRPAGYIATAGTAGTFQMRYAQNTSNATALVIVAGSWLRLVKQT